VIIPLLHRIIVKQDRLEEKDDVYRRATAAGLEIPKLDEKLREQAAIDTGVVVKIGTTAFIAFGADTPPVEIGDYVVFAKHAGKTIVDPEDGQKYVALNDEDLICKMTGA
jgi:co-chaperonin GroES (HSP10)